MKRKNSLSNLLSQNFNELSAAEKEAAAKIARAVVPDKSESEQPEQYTAGLDTLTPEMGNQASKTLQNKKLSNLSSMRLSRKSPE